MKKILLVALLAIFSTVPAYAEDGRGDGGHYGGDRGGGRHYGGDRGDGGDGGGNWLFPALIGGAIGYGLANQTYTQPAPVYVQPAPVYQQPAPVYQQYPPVISPPSSQYWYFCPAFNAYYPYVSSCPTQWQLLLAMPPR